MKNSLYLSISIFVFCFSSINAQSVQSPSEFLGYKIGTRFTRHHKVIAYFKHISETSNLVSIEKYGETNENRPLYVSYISSEENIQNI